MFKKNYYLLMILVVSQVSLTSFAAEEAPAQETSPLLQRANENSLKLKLSEKELNEQGTTKAAVVSKIEQDVNKLDEIVKRDPEAAYFAGVFGKQYQKIISNLIGIDFYPTQGMGVTLIPVNVKDDWAAHIYYPLDNANINDARRNIVRKLQKMRESLNQ